MSGIVGKNLGRGSGVITATPVGADAVSGANVADDAIGSEHLSDNAVGLTAMAGNTDGVIISFDASGDPVAVGPGSDGEVLTSTGAGSPPAFEAAAGGGIIVQIVHVQDGAAATGTTVVPFDNTIPQNTEGDQWMSLAITPTSATNKLFIHLVICLTTANGKWQMISIFQDSTAGALATTRNFGTSQVSAPAVMNHYMTAGTTSSTTFKIRSGPHASDTTSFNGELGNSYFDGIFASTLTITEIAV